MVNVPDFVQLNCISIYLINRCADSPPVVGVLMSLINLMRCTAESDLTNNVPANQLLSSPLRITRQSLLPNVSTATINWQVIGAALQYPLLIKMLWVAPTWAMRTSRNCSWTNRIRIHTLNVKWSDWRHQLLKATHVPFLNTKYTKKTQAEGSANLFANIN